MYWSWCVWNAGTGVCAENLQLLLHVCLCSRVRSKNDIPRFPQVSRRPVRVRYSSTVWTRTIFRSGTDLISLSLLILFLCFDQKAQGSVVSNPIGVKFGAIVPRVNTNILYNLFGEYASIDGVGFRIWRHTFKMAAMTSCLAEKCRPPVSAYEASARRICSSFRQFLIYSTFRTRSINIDLLLEMTNRPNGTEFLFNLPSAMIIVYYSYLFNNNKLHNKPVGDWFAR